LIVADPSDAVHWNEGVELFEFAFNKEDSPKQTESGSAEGLIEKSLPTVTSIKSLPGQAGNAGSIAVTVYVVVTAGLALGLLRVSGCALVALYRSPVGVHA